MYRFRLLLDEHLKIRMPNLNVLDFALHRHLHEQSAVETHRHRWSQVILYLSGAGSQVLPNGQAPVGPGTLVVLPPAVPHAFRRTTERMPLSLVIDFNLSGARSLQPVVCNLNHSELMEIRQQLAYLLRLQSKDADVRGWENVTVILKSLITLLRTANWLEQVPLSSPEARDSAMHRLLFAMDLTAPLRQIVHQSGYQRDHLNRLVKKEAGLTLGQFRAQRRLEKAKELLSHGFQIGSVGNAIGMLDQSYFARWFRRQTGLSPSQWARNGEGLRPGASGQLAEVR